jgi:Putative prokaryotic signal transducing protein
MNLMRATTANDLEQATAIRDVLSEAGIAATLRGGLHDAYPGTSGLGAIDVLVSEQDLAQAQDVLSRADDAALEFDADEEA